MEEKYPIVVVVVVASVRSFPVIFTLIRVLSGYPILLRPSQHDAGRAEAEPPRTARTSGASG